MRKIKTDNPMTKAVLDANEVLRGVEESIKNMAKVPFMKRERTKYEKSPKYLERNRP